MAYLNQQEEDEQQGVGLNQTLAPQVGQTAPAPVNEPAQGQNSGAATSTQAAVPSQSVNPKAGSGSFTNLRSYLNANQGNRIASAASQKIQNTASGAQKGIARAGSTFGKQVDQGSLANMGTAVQETTDISKAARGVAAQPQTVLTPPQPVATPQSPNQAALDGTQPAEAPAPAAAPAPVQEETPQYLSDDQQQRFAEIINAKYKGPQSLRQSGLYDQTSGKVQEAQKNIDAAKSVQGREQLLRDMFSKGRDYSRGQSNLDSLLLNTSQQGVQQVQDQAKAAGNVQSELEKAQNTSQNLATSRTNEIAGIQEDARTAFSGEQTAERDLTEQRIADMTTKPVLDAAGNPVLKTDGSPMTEWDRLPEHFKSAIKNRVSINTASMGQQTAALKEANAPAIAAYNTAKKSTDSAKAALQKAQRTKMMSGIDIFGTGSQNISPEATAKMDADIAAADAAYKQASQQLSAASKPYKEYQSQISSISGANKNNLNLSAEEAAILGIGAGEGIFNLDENLVKTNAADKTKLISRDEVARQQALAQLAGLDAQKRLSTNQEYGMEGAGTQSSLDALNTAGIREELNAIKKAFEEKVKGQNITGFGNKKNKTSGKRYYAQETQNLGKLLKNAGYDFNAPENTQLGNADILKNISGRKSTDQDSPDIGTINPEVNLNGALEPYSDNSGLDRKLGYAAADVGSMGITAGLRALGLDSTGTLMNALSGISGGALFGGGSSSKESKSDAARFARQDLQRKIDSEINKSGVKNRAGIVDNQATQDRDAGLRELIARMDKTNV